MPLRGCRPPAPASERREPRRRRVTSPHRSALSSTGQPFTWGAPQSAAPTMPAHCAGRAPSPLPTTPDPPCLDPRESDHRSGTVWPGGDVAGIGETSHPSPLQLDVEIGGHRTALHPLDHQPALAGVRDGPERIKMVAHQPAGIDIERRNPSRPSTDETDRCSALGSPQRQLTGRLPPAQHGDPFPSSDRREIDAGAVLDPAPELDSVRHATAPRIPSPQHLPGMEDCAGVEVDLPVLRRAVVAHRSQFGDGRLDDTAVEPSSGDQCLTEAPERLRRRPPQRPDHSGRRCRCTDPSNESICGWACT